MERTIFVYTNSPKKAQLLDKDIAYNSICYKEFVVNSFHKVDIKVTIQEFGEWVYLNGKELKFNNLTFYKFPANILYKNLQLKISLLIKEKTKQLVKAINNNIDDEIIKEFVKFNKNIKEHTSNYFYMYDNHKLWDIQTDFEFVNYIIQNKNQLDYIYFYQSFKF